MIYGFYGDWNCLKCANKVLQCFKFSVTCQRDKRNSFKNCFPKSFFMFCSYINKNNFTHSLMAAEEQNFSWEYFTLPIECFTYIFFTFVFGFKRHNASFYHLKIIRWVLVRETWNGVLYKFRFDARNLRVMKMLNPCFPNTIAI